RNPVLCVAAEGPCMGGAGPSAGCRGRGWASLRTFCETLPERVARTTASAAQRIRARRDAQPLPATSTSSGRPDLLRAARINSLVRPMRTPLYEQHSELGAKIVDFAGWEMPVQFEGIREEHVAVRTHAGMFDVSHMGEVEVEGPGALAFLQRALSNDVAAIEVGGAQYSCLCDERGGVLDDLFAYRLGGDRYLLVTNAANHGADLAWLGGVSREFDVLVRDVADRYAMLAVQGPHARDVVERTLRLELPPRMRVAPVRVGRRPALACGTGYTGE